MGKRVAILQSCYIPWKGYFDQIAAVDEFILYDDAQYTKDDWRNRNQVKTAQGLAWLTVPVKVKGRLGMSIREAEIDGDGWARKHWKTLCNAYAKAPFFAQTAARLEAVYTQSNFAYLYELNHLLLTLLCDMLAIETKISRSWDYPLVEGKTERLVDLCLKAGASEYISGPAAKEYLDEAQFAQAGIAVSWFDYAGYPEYPQLWGAFKHEVSVVDLLFNCGPNARRYMKCGL